MKINQSGNALILFPIMVSALGALALSLTQNSDSTSLFELRQTNLALEEMDTFYKFFSRQIKKDCSTYLRNIRANGALSASETAQVLNRIEYAPSHSNYSISVETFKFQNNFPNNPGVLTSNYLETELTISFVPTKKTMALRETTRVLTVVSQLKSSDRTQIEACVGTGTPEALALYFNANCDINNPSSGSYCNGNDATSAMLRTYCTAKYPASGENQSSPPVGSVCDTLSTFYNNPRAHDPAVPEFAFFNPNHPFFGGGGTL